MSRQKIVMHSEQIQPEKHLDAYLVGGAVRDQLLGLQVKDRDWVVVGATPQQMLELGFKSVGKDFPVFLHPHTKEEYALAREERKTDKGYHGFQFDYNQGITLEQDLARRDLTINAIAMDAHGHLIDPFNGKQDIENRVLRHVSDAFSEDPVRVLRVARFAARFDCFDFLIDQSTQSLMREIVRSGETDALVAERVWKELFLCMQQGRLSVFIEVLRQCGALRTVLPEIDKLFGVPQTEKYHPEVDTGKHILLSLGAAQKLSDNPEIIFAVLLHDLGKGVTEESQLPSHKGHEQSGLPLVEQVCQRLAVPKRFRKLALQVCQWHLHCHRMYELRPETVLRLLEGLDAFRDTQVVEKFSLCCMADQRGRTGYEASDYPQMQLLTEYYQAVSALDIQSIVSGLQATDTKNLGRQINSKITQARVEKIAQIKNKLSA